MDNNFNDLYNFSVDINLTTQGMTYWNDHIYFACHESGQAGNEYQTVCNYNEKKTYAYFGCGSFAYACDDRLRRQQ